jgi:hypothetical protein
VLNLGAFPANLGANLGATWAPNPSLIPPYGEVVGRSGCPTTVSKLGGILGGCWRTPASPGLTQP